MMMPLLTTGDVVTVAFAGARSTKRRLAVVVSGGLYHQTRPDVVIGLLTTQIGAATTPTDYILQDATQAGLRQPSAFRAYFDMAAPSELTVIGHLSERDQEAVQKCVALTFGLPPLP